MVSDALELELRHIHGVSFAAFADIDGTTLVELVVVRSADLDSVRAEALRLAHGLLEGPVVVDLIDDRELPVDTRPDLRVQLQVIVPVGDGSEVEIHLAHGDRRACTEAAADEPEAAAGAVLDGLAALGLRAPFEVTSVHLLDRDLGEGALVVLRDQITGAPRRGVAAGRTGTESVARAVLNALNRFLQPTHGYPASAPPG